MIPARFWLLSSTLSFKSVKSIFPLSSHLTTTTFIPAITALAGFVPCAEEGIKKIFR